MSSVRTSMVGVNHISYSNKWGDNYFNTVLGSTGIGVAEDTTTHHRTINRSAKLQVGGTDQGFLVPVVTTTQLDSIRVDGIQRIVMGSVGSGYTSVPTVTITGGGGSGATATAYRAAANQVAFIEIDNPGRGYTSAPTVTISGGGGSGATATATLYSSNGLQTYNATIHSPMQYVNGAWTRGLVLPNTTPTTNHIPIWNGTAWTTGAVSVPTGGGGIYGGNGSIANNTTATLVANGFFRFVSANGTEVISMKDGTTAGLGSVALYSTRLAYVYGGDSTALWGARVQVKNPTTSLAGLLELHEARDNGTNSAKIQAPANLAADYTLTTPPDDGGDRDVLMTDGSGVTTWKTNPRAEISATATRHYTLTTAATNYTVDTLSSAFLTEFTYSAGVLTYTGTATRRFLINYSLSIATDDSVLLQAGIDKNGAGPLTSTRQAASIGTTTGHAATANISGSGIVGLATSDTVKIVIQSDGAGAPIASVRFASFTLTSID